MSMFKRTPRPQEQRVPQAEWAGTAGLLDDLAEASWLLRMAQLGLGFNPDLLALAERFDEPAGLRDPGMRAFRPLAGTQAVR